MDLYFIEANNEIKIGISTRTKERVKDLQTANAAKFKILYIIENVEKSFEKHVHGVCYKYNIRGEWFSKECLDHLLNHPWFYENMKSISSK